MTNQHGGKRDNRKRSDKDGRGGPRIAGPGKRIGRPPTGVAIRIDLETAALAQRLMLHFPDLPNVEALFAYAIRKLAETTDD